MVTINLMPWMTPARILDEAISRRGYQCRLALAWPADEPLWRVLQETLHQMARVAVIPDARIWPLGTPLVGYLTELTVAGILTETVREVTLLIVPG